MAAGRPYPQEVKARAVAAILAGSSVADVAATFDIPKPTVHSWRRELRNADIGYEPEKKDALGELVYGYLTEAIQTLAAQARFSRDEDWLRRQNASDLAILHGVINDKTVRLLAALQPAEDADSPALGE